MPTFELHRETPLSTAEVAALPGGAVPVRGEGAIVARARFRALESEAAVRLAFALGQAAPGARLVVEGLAAIDPSPTDASTEDTLWAQPAEETQEEPLAVDVEDAPEADLDLPPPEPTDEVPLPEGGPAAEPEVALEDDDGGDDADAQPADTEPPTEPLAAPAVAPAAEADELADEETAPLLPSEPITREDPGPPPPMPLIGGEPPPASTALVAAPEREDDGDTLVPEEPWAAWDAGDAAGALRAFASAGLDSDGRARVRALLQSTDPAEVAQGCDIARAAEWRSSVQAMRRLLQHADTRVRQSAVTAIGELAGPALVPAVRMLLRDASPGVRGAAVAALLKLESR